MAIPDVGAYEYQGGMMATKKTVSFTLEIVAAPNFFPAIVPTTLRVVTGIVAVYNLSFTAEGGFTGPVTLAVVGLPAGSVGTFSKTSINLGETSVLSITTIAPPGLYSCGVEGTANL
jgi:hypothetical protein